MPDQLDQISNARAEHNKSVSGLSKAKSQVSFRINQMDSQRAISFNTDLALKLSYEWKNIYRSVLAADVLQKGKVTVNKFNQILLSHNVTLTKEEIRRLLKLSKSETADLNSHEFPIEDVMNN